MNTKSERFEMRLDQDTLNQIDRWRSNQQDIPSRAEAIRRLVDYSLCEAGESEMFFSDGERLIILMLSQLYKSLKIKSELDPSFIESALYGGHYWALQWQYTGIFHSHRDSRKSVTEVVDILDMWKFLEVGYNTLPAKEKKFVQEETERKIIQFTGFDGNNETEHMGIANFLIQDMGRFKCFEGRDLNSHHPSLDGYRRMLSVFLPIRTTLVRDELSAKQIVDIINERIHPSHKKS